MYGFRSFEENSLGELLALLACFTLLPIVIFFLLQLNICWYKFEIVELKSVSIIFIKSFLLNSLFLNIRLHNRKLFYTLIPGVCKKYINKAYLVSQKT